MIVTTLVIVSYMFLGGYLAVCWTDLIQGILLFGALLFCAILGYLAFADTTVDIAVANPKAFDWRAGSILTGASLMAWGFGYFGQPRILARFLGIRSTEDVPAARRIGMSWMIIALIAFLIAANDTGSILSMVAYAWGGFGAAFGQLIILSLVRRDTTKAGAITGIIVGAASIFIFKNYVSIEGHYLYELLPSFVLAFISIIVVSKFTARPSDELLAKLGFQSTRPIKWHIIS